MLILSLLKKIFNRRFCNQQGQVAIFVALIFQVLFVFFAMLVNVGLLVHHKINLQNSADMAAYYGSMKQAEILNAMAHVNYQIRQSWKLLSWRYRVIGTFGHKWNTGVAATTSTSSNGAARMFPFDWTGAPAATGNFFPSRIDEDENGPPGVTPAVAKLWYERPLFCVAHAGFKDWPSGENLCNVDAGVLSGANNPITNPNTISVTGGLAGSAISSTVNTAIQTAASLAAAKCTKLRYANYYLLGLFTLSYQLDGAIRKATFKKLYELLSNNPSTVTGFNGRPESTFKDLNGEDVAIGARETLLRNLTEPNKENAAGLTVKTYNGLSGQNCGFDNAFKENVIFPHMFFLTSECNGNAGGVNNFSAKHLVDRTEPASAFASRCNPAAADFFSQEACRIADLIYNTGLPDLNMGIGYQRNPRCVPYFAVRAESTPKIPFMPISGVKLVAESYTQSFGGSIGPWWGNDFAGTNPDSITDKLGPKKITAPPGAPISIAASDQAANFSKYPGDLYGLKSNAQLSFYAHEILNRINQSPTKIAISDWAPMAQGDVYLSSNALVKNLELAAIAPDLYDVTYYSIEPDFYANYFKQILKAVGTKQLNIGGINVPLYIHPDLGSEKNPANEYSAFSVRDQLKAAETIFNSSAAASAGFGPPRNRMLGSIARPGNMLTSWNVFELGEYDTDNSIGSEMWDRKFGKCQTPNGEADYNYVLNPPTSGNCLNGGRTGFSVRLLSKKFLKTGMGTIQNPPPDPSVW